MIPGRRFALLLQTVSAAIIEGDIAGRRQQRLLLRQPREGVGEGGRLLQGGPLH